MLTPTSTGNSTRVPTILSSKSPIYTDATGVVVLRAIPKHLYRAPSSERRKTPISCKRSLHIPSPLRFSSADPSRTRTPQLHPNHPHLRPLSDSITPWLNEGILATRRCPDIHGPTRSSLLAAITSPQFIAPVAPRRSRTGRTGVTNVPKIRSEDHNGGSVAAALEKNQRMLEHAQEDLARELRNKSEGPISRAQKQLALLQKMNEVHRLLLMPRYPSEIALLGLMFSVSTI